jgi:hypothetical protein
LGVLRAAGAHVYGLLDLSIFALPKVTVDRMRFSLWYPQTSKIFALLRPEFFQYTVGSIKRMPYENTRTEKGRAEQLRARYGSLATSGLIRLRFDGKAVFGGKRHTPKGVLKALAAQNSPDVRAAQTRTRNLRSKGL